MGLGLDGVNEVSEMPVTKDRKTLTACPGGLDRGHLEL